METYKLIYFYLPSILFLVFLLVCNDNLNSSSATNYFKRLVRLLLLIIAVPGGCALIGILLTSPISLYQDQNETGLIWSQGGTTHIIGAILGMCIGIGISIYILLKRSLCIEKIAKNYH